jgi:polyphosphate kinase
VPRAQTEHDAEQPTDVASRYFNRELSRLDFMQRVLALSDDETQPLLERVRFLAIFTHHLDEFFQIRVAGLKEQAAADLPATSVDGLDPREQLAAIRARVHELTADASRIMRELRERLGVAGIRIVEWDELKAAHQDELRSVFEARIFPVLTPLAVDPAHPFPYISDLSLNLAVIARDPLTREPRFARVKVPPLLPRFLKVSGGRRFVPIEQVIAAHLDLLFPGMKIESFHVFRVTRDADIEIEIDEAEDLLSALTTELLRRRRSPEVVRLEVNPTMPKEIRSLLQRELRLKSSDVFVVEGLLDLGDLWPLAELRRPSLKRQPWHGVTQARLAGKGNPTDLFAVLRSGDVLVHHPYDAFSTSVEEFVRQAADDPHVLAIKQTLYRTSDEESPIVQALVRAAEAGKQVVALVELTARGDEEANIVWAQRLETAGVHVVYGVVGLKTHAKTVLVVRDEGGAIRRYCHVGTGNYNPVTARAYEDVGLLSADDELTADVADLFNYLTGYSSQRRFRKALVAPAGLRTRLIELIRGEARPDGRIVIKVNNLIDPETIDALYEASQAGASIDLVVRSMCCLRPGVRGLSDAIRVRSVVGRYLEHSRILRFGSDERGPRYYIGSADLMQRNLDRRVECVAPVADPELTARLEEILAVALADDVLAWQLGPDGWSKVPTVLGIDSQTRLEELAEERARTER